MSNSKKIIIIMIIIVIIIIAIILSLLFIQNKGLILYGIDETGDNSEETLETNISRVTNRNDFFSIKNCVEKYYIYYAGMYNTGENNDIIDEEAEASIKEEKIESANALYNILDTEYIEAKQITKANISTKFTEITEPVVSIKDMYMSEQTGNITIYIVEGSIREKKSGKITNYKIIVKQDRLNRTFTVLPNDYAQEKYKNIEIGKTINIEVPKEIEQNTNNMYDLKTVTEEEYVNSLININEFKTYAKNNTKNYVALKVQKYQKTENEGYTRYVMIDTDGDYHIFQEIAPMKYTVMLDTYWIDIPEFIEKYDKSIPQEQVILNLNKFMQALNDKDYKYAYSILAESFKQTNFKTQAEFEAYAKTNFFEKNEFKYEKFGNEANTYYTYQIKVTDKEKVQNNEVTKTFIILLEERKTIPVII